MIAVVSYGVCNVGSILNMLKRIGAQAAPVSTPDGLEAATRIILPGIGAFDNGVDALTSLGLFEPLKRRATEDRVPLLGICLGMQLLGRSSEEGRREGLALLDACSVRFRPAGATPIRVPHMGWNHLAAAGDTPLLRNLDGNARFYFVHSYHLVCADRCDVLATARHGVDFTAMVHRGNVWGAQFHPEKSHRFGMTLLENFATL